MVFFAGFFRLDPSGSSFRFRLLPLVSVSDSVSAIGLRGGASLVVIISPSRRSRLGASESPNSDVVADYVFRSSFVSHQNTYSTGRHSRRRHFDLVGGFVERAVHQVRITLAYSGPARQSRSPSRH